MLTNLRNFRNRLSLLMAIMLVGSIFVQIPASAAIASDTYTELVNHDFETGDLTGWKVESGTAFSAADITSDTTFWGGPFNQNGNHHLWSYKEGGDGQTGVLSSGLFTLGGQGQIDFLISGGNDINNLYVALVRASDGQVLFKATGAETEQYSRVSWDAASYIGENLYIKVVDQATGDWGHVNIDDVNVQVQPKELFNHSFESAIYGDQIPSYFRGWTVVSGNDAYTNPEMFVTSHTNWWGGTFNQDGIHHLWGFKENGNGDYGLGVIKSENFVLSGNGSIDFLIGGGNDINKLYVALTRVSDGAELFKATGNNSETYRRVQWDALQYAGQELYIKVVDNSTASWGHVNLDDVNVQIQSGSVSSDTQAPTPPTVSSYYAYGTKTIDIYGSTDNVEVYGYLVTIDGNTTFYNKNYNTVYFDHGVGNTISVKAVDAAGNVSGPSATYTINIYSSDRIRIR